MRAEVMLDEAIRWLDRVLELGDPYISEDDKAEIRETKIGLKRKRKLALDREEDDYRARDSSPQGL